MTAGTPPAEAAPAAGAAEWEQLAAQMRELFDLYHMASLLGWDREVCMSLQGADARARQMATLRVIRHERLTDPRLEDLMGSLAGQELDAPRREMLRLLRRDRDRALRLPADFVRRLGLAEARGAVAWRIAREEGDFALLQPALEEVIAAKREEADLVGLDGERYDSLLDPYEPGMRVARLEPLLRSLRSELVALFAAIKDAPQIEPQPFEGRLFPDQAQWDLTMRLLADVGFDLTAGRQDRSAHPFTQSLALHDVRVTTRIDERFPMSGIYATLHEAGHGMYEQGFDPQYEDTPLAEAPSLGLHESQSRLWENIVGRSLAFWERYAPVMGEMFGEAAAGCGPEEFYRACNRVQPSLIRVEADEITYNLHILIRFELELALLRDELEVADLPAAWNDAYAETLGIRPENDVLGVMQDIHWPSGSIGYFPTYTLGNVYSGMLWEAYEAADPDWKGHIRRGEFDHLLGWLREQVHRSGSMEQGEDLVQRVTGSTLDHGPLMRYLRGKFAPLYGLSD